MRCVLIKNSADYRNIPVIMLSSNDGIFDKARARRLGSSAHLSKPFSAESLTSAVGALLNYKVSQADVTTALTKPATGKEYL